MSNEVKLSTTRINVFLQCKLKYKFNYIDHLPKVSNPAFKLGTACHEALELAGNIWKQKENFSVTDTKKILDKYTEVAIREGMDDMTIYAVGMNLIKNKLPGFAEDKKIIELEKKFGLGDAPPVLTKDGVPLIGAIDKVVEHDEDTLVIIDYKTQNTAPTPEYVRTDLQLSLYDLVGSRIYPQYKRIILCLDLLKFEPIYSYRTHEERVEFENYLKILYDIMTSFDPNNDATASLNIFCSWCDYKDYCPAYLEACKKSDYKFLKLNDATNEELLTEWTSLRSTKNLIEGRKRDIDSVIMNRIRQTGENLATGEEEIYLRQNSRTDYDVKTVFDTVPVEDFVGLVSINKSAVKKYIETNKALGVELKKGSISNFTAPFTDARKIKKDKKSKKKLSD